MKTLLALLILSATPDMAYQVTPKGHMLPGDSYQVTPNGHTIPDYGSGYEVTPNGHTVPRPYEPDAMDVHLEHLRREAATPVKLYPGECCN